MRLTLKPYLLTPKERVDVVGAIVKLVETHEAFANHGFRLMAATAQPYAGPARLNVKVNVIVDQTPRDHADLGRGPDVAPPEHVVSRHIKLNFLTTRQSLHRDQFSFGEPILGEQLIVDENLERAFAILAGECRCTTAYLGQVLDIRAFAKVAWQKYWGSKVKEGHGLQESVALAVLQPPVEQRAEYCGYDAEQLLSHALKAAEARACDVDPVALPSQAWDWAKDRLAGPDLPVADSMYGDAFRAARLAALDAIPSHALNPAAAATNVLLVQGGTRPLQPTVYNHLLAALNQDAAPVQGLAPTDHEGDDFLL